MADVSQEKPRQGLPAVIGSNALFLIAIVLLLAGILKLANVGAKDMVEGLEKAHLLQHRTLISVTAISCGALLLIPFTRLLGFLAATAYWGGAIVAHLSYNDSALMPAVFLGFMWLAGWFRYRVLGRL